MVRARLSLERKQSELERLQVQLDDAADEHAAAMTKAATELANSKEAHKRVQDSY